MVQPCLTTQSQSHASLFQPLLLLHPARVVWSAGAVACSAEPTYSRQARRPLLRHPARPRHRGRPTKTGRPLCGRGHDPGGHYCTPRIVHTCRSNTITEQTERAVIELVELPVGLRHFGALPAQSRMDARPGTPETLSRTGNPPAAVLPFAPSILLLIWTVFYFRKKQCGKKILESRGRHGRRVLKLITARGSDPATPAVGLVVNAHSIRINVRHGCGTASRQLQLF